MIIKRFLILALQLTYRWHFLSEFLFFISLLKLLLFMCRFIWNVSKECSVWKQDRTIRNSTRFSIYWYLLNLGKNHIYGSWAFNSFKKWKKVSFKTCFHLDTIQFFNRSFLLVWNESNNLISPFIRKTRTINRYQRIWLYWIRYFTEPDQIMLQTFI